MTLLRRTIRTKDIGIRLDRDVTTIVWEGRYETADTLSLESLEKTDFSFASRGGLTYPMDLSPRAFLHLMIVCSCNVFTDHDVRAAVSVAPMPPRTPGQIYGCLGCSAQCGRCARTIKTIMDEALGACATSCRSGCPHSPAGAESHVHSEFSLAAS